MRFKRFAAGLARVTVAPSNTVTIRSHVAGSGTGVVPPKSTLKVRSVRLTELVIGKSGGSAFGPVRLVMSNCPED